MTEAMVVRWFQSWRCGCTWLDDTRPPERCPTHNDGALGIHGIPELCRVAASCATGLEPAVPI